MPELPSVPGMRGRSVRCLHLRLAVLRAPSLQLVQWYLRGRDVHSPRGNVHRIQQLLHGPPVLDPNGQCLPWVRRGMRVQELSQLKE